MVRPLLHDRQLVRPASRPDQGFGLGPTLGVLVAFLAIHIHLALRVPLATPEAGALLRAPQLILDLPYLLATLGQSLAPEGLSARLGFIFVSMLTSLAAFGATRRMTLGPLAPALAVIWLNTTILFGVGSILATREALAALGLTLALFGFVAARRSPGAGPWSIALLGFVIAASSHPAAAFALIGAPLAMATDKKARRWLLQFGFGVFFGLTVTALWAGFTGFHQPWQAPDPMVLVFAPLIALGPGVMIFCGLGFAASLGFQGQSRSVAVPAAMLIGLGVAVLTGAAEPGDLAMTAPLICVMAAVAAANARGFVSERLLEATTPLAFLTMLFAVYVTAVPTNSFLPRIPWLSGLFGWETLAAQVEREAEAAEAAYVLVADRAVAQALGETLSRPVLFTDPSTIWAVPNCTVAGLFVSRNADANDLLGNFRQIARQTDASRMAGAWAVDLFTVYRVAEPTVRSGCPSLGN